MKWLVSFIEQCNFSSYFSPKRSCGYSCESCSNYANFRALVNFSKALQRPNEVGRAKLL
jgi:hypothetical protein